MSNMARLEQIVAALPDTKRVDIEAWDGEPTFRVNNKAFIFTDPEATGVCVKLPKEEAAAVIATDERAKPAGYGLGRHGWVDIRFGDDLDERRWREITEWIRTSYTLVAPKRLARQVLAEESTTD